MRLQSDQVLPLIELLRSCAKVAFSSTQGYFLFASLLQDLFQGPKWQMTHRA